MEGKHEDMKTYGKDRKKLASSCLGEKTVRDAFFP
jgi:hypothetical protein